MLEMCSMLEPLEPRILLSAYPGDLNGDWGVDLDDFVVLKSQFHADLAQFIDMKANWGTSVFDVPIHADPATPFAYNRFDGSLVDDGIDYGDFIQGRLADCWLISGLASIALIDPGVLEDAISAIGDGTYWVQYYDYAGTAQYLRIDADLPAQNGRLIYARAPDGLMGPLLEKACAHVRYGMDSYASLAYGWGFQVWGWFAGWDSRLVGDFALLAPGDTVASGIGTNLIVPNHEYVVLDADATGITVYNPWGYDGREASGDPSDGVIYLTMGEAEEAFTTAISPVFY